MIVAAALLLYQTIMNLEYAFSVDLKWALQPVYAEDARSPTPHDPVHDYLSIPHALHTTCCVADRRSAAEAPSKPSGDLSTSLTGPLHTRIEQFCIFAIQSNNGYGIMRIKGGYPTPRNSIRRIRLFLVW